jgi:hypothetical protein
MKRFVIFHYCNPAWTFGPNIAIMPSTTVATSSFIIVQSVANRGASHG